ncbi:hypothetical protein MP228_006330 [Amoeboaphelidium protococcarum]|nr:hypothetical protein MP228_006330 [Amoeboaphelidium protococcarum]
MPSSQAESNKVMNYNSDHVSKQRQSTDEEDEVFQDASAEVESPMTAEQQVEQQEQEEYTINTSDVDPNQITAVIYSSDDELVQEMEQLKAVIDLVLNSEFGKAQKFLESKPESLCFTHGYSVLMTIKSMMTFEKADFKRALDLCSKTILMADVMRLTSNKNRRKKQGFFRSMVNSLTGREGGAGESIFDEMTLVERHAELIYAEIHLSKAMISIFHDESILSFIKEGIKIRQSWFTYKKIYQWLNQQSVQHPDKLNREFCDAHFLSGVQLGIGLFNLILGLLPERALQLMEFAGFSGSKQVGLDTLADTSSLGGIRYFVCQLMLVGFYVVIPAQYPYMDRNERLISDIMTQQLTQHPKSAFYLFFQGRVEFLHRQHDKAIDYCERSMSSQRDWVQLHHICMWSNAICSCIQMNYQNAQNLMAELQKSSRWSKATNCYLVGIFMYMQLNDKMSQEDQVSLKFQIDHSFRDVPQLMQRIAGRRIPIEKFVNRKTRKYFAQKQRLFLPAFEMMLIWGAFHYMPTELLQVAAQQVEQELESMDKITSSGTQLSNGYDYYQDDVALGHYMLAVIRRSLKDYRASLLEFDVVIAQRQSIKLDHYIIAYAYYDRAVLYLLQFTEANSNTDDAEKKQYLKNAKSDLEMALKSSKKISLENSLNLRVHFASRRVEELEATLT